MNVFALTGRTGSCERAAEAEGAGVDVWKGMKDRMLGREETGEEEEGEEEEEQQQQQQQPRKSNMLMNSCQMADKYNEIHSLMEEVESKKRM
eukprot:768415-Hanusia_phi.AAC.3